MKVTNQACLQFLTSATTTMAAVVAQRDHGVASAIKPNNGQDHIDQRSNKAPSSFNNVESSSFTIEHYDTTQTTGSTTTTFALLESSFPNSNEVLHNNGLKPCRDTQRNDGTNNKDADIGILDCGVNEFCLVLPRDYNNVNTGMGRCVNKTSFLSPHYNNNDMVPLLTQSSETKSVHRTNELHSVGTLEAQQNRRRLVDIVCPPPMPDVCPNSIALASGDTLFCTDHLACESSEVTFDTGSTITCSAYQACIFMDARGAGTMTCTEYESCVFATVALQNGGQLECDYEDACFVADVTFFDTRSTIDCRAPEACRNIAATGAGTMTCTEYDSCYFATVALQNGGRLECDHQDACFGADVSFGGTALMECLTADACASPYGFNNIYATASGGTLLCRAENSCQTNLHLSDYSFLLICEDSFSCDSNPYTTVEGIASTCVVCVQENSCTNLDEVFFSIDAEKDQPQLAGMCTDDQIATMCNVIDPDLASTLDFGNGLVCVQSMSSETLTTSPQPSWAPSNMPHSSSGPSIAPSKAPITGKKGAGKKG